MTRSASRNLTGRMEMDADVGNQEMLKAGAYYQRQMTQSENWQPMASAPRDGTPVEIKNSYGVAPWYGLFRWTDETTIRTAESYTDAEGKHRTRDLGEQAYKLPKPTWVSIGRQGQSVDDGPYLQWRAYGGSADSYVDPTGGAQNSAAYWRGAVAAKHGLPLDYFEKETARNVQRNAAPKKPTGFWDWLFGH